MKIKDAFIVNQGHQITDEEIYQAIPNKGKIPILTANNEIKGIWDKVIVSSDDLPCITYPTKANMGTCFIQDKIFDANNTAVLTFREEKWKKEIYLEWLVFKLSKLFFNVSTSKEGVNYLNKEIIDELEIELPKRDKQIEQYKAISKLLNIKQIVVSNIEKVNDLKKRDVLIDYKDYQVKDLSTNELFDYMGGNSGLTEEYLYQNMFVKKEKKYKVLTGSIDVEEVNKAGLYPEPKNQTKTMAVFTGEGIHVVRKGDAGRINYLKPDDYTLNDDAYILKLKKDLKYDVSLKWICIQYPQLFLEFASSSDNGTWNMTGFFEHAKFDIPDRKEQDRLVAKFEVLYTYERALIAILKKLERVLDKDMVE